MFLILFFNSYWYILIYLKEWQLRLHMSILWILKIIVLSFETAVAECRLVSEVLLIDKYMHG